MLDSFDEQEIALFVRQWFRGSGDGMDKSDVDRLAAGFLSESSFLPDLRSSPLLLSLLCSIYRVTGQLPSNLADVYGLCSDLLFDRWDRARGISNGVKTSTARSALADLAFVMLQDPPESLVLSARRVVQILSDYFEARMGDRDEAEFQARELLDWCSGRAWLFTDVGSDGLEPLYGFTHRSFLDYFAALKLSRSADPIHLAEILTPRIAAGEWPMIGQIAIQLADRNVENAAARLAAEMLERASSLPVKEQERVVQFLESCAELVDFPLAITTELDRSAGRLGDAGRLCIAVDIVYDRHAADSATQLQESTPAIVHSALHHANIESASVVSMAMGNAWFFVMPQGANEIAVVLRVIEGLRRALVALNSNRSAAARTWLRVAFNRGQVRSTLNGVVGFAVVEASRMLESSQLRTSIAKSLDANLAIALSDEIHAELAALRSTPPGLDPLDRAVLEPSKNRPSLSLSFWVHAA
jgi:hypothetical protein